MEIRVYRDHIGEEVGAMGGVDIQAGARAARCVRDGLEAFFRPLRNVEAVHRDALHERLLIIYSYI